MPAFASHLNDLSRVSSTPSSVQYVILGIRDDYDTENLSCKSHKGDHGKCDALSDGTNNIAPFPVPWLVRYQHHIFRYRIRVNGPKMAHTGNAKYQLSTLDIPTLPGANTP